MCTPFRRGYCARHVADAVRIGRLAVAYAFDLLMYLHHLGLAEPRWLADRQRVDIHLRQGLHLDSEPDGFFECLGRHDQAVMAEQAGIAAFKRLVGVTSMPPGIRCERLPEVPWLRPLRFISRQVSTMPWRRSAWLRSVIMLAPKRRSRIDRRR